MGAAGLVLLVRDDGVKSLRDLEDRSSFFSRRVEPDRVTFHLSFSFLLRLCVGLEGVVEGEPVASMMARWRGGEVKRLSGLESESHQEIKVSASPAGHGSLRHTWRRTPP